MTSWQNVLPEAAVTLDGGIAYSWMCGDQTHRHSIECLWVWHDCGEILGSETVAPGEHFGWRPSGVAAHTLVQIEPLTITASVYWPECCGKHGFITNGSYRDC